MLDNDLDALARCDLDPCRLERIPAVDEGEVEVVQHKTFGRLVSQRNPTRVPPGWIGCPQGLAQRDDA
jgi:hypothetical protein